MKPALDESGGASAQSFSGSGTSVKIGSLLPTNVSGSNDITGFTLVQGGNATYFPLTGVDALGFEATQGAAELYAREELETVYLQWSEADSGPGQSTRAVAAAREDLVEASIALLNDDSINAMNRLILAETTLFTALAKVQFNEAFYSVISFCAWALKRVAIEPKPKAPLELMISALTELERKPFISLARAAEVVDELESAGWNGDSPAVEAFRRGVELEDGQPLSLE